MFTRIVEVPRKGKTYKYLRLIENTWKNGKTVQRVVANFGNVETLNVKKIDSAIASLLRYSSGYFKDIRKLKTLNVKQLGEILAGEKIWKELEMNDILRRYLNHTRLSGNATLLIKTMILSRLVEPMSKLALSENYQQLALSELEGKSFIPQHFYRAMDELIPHKDRIEIALHEREKDLFSMNLNLVFYDLTSSYFEGDACPLGKHGYSRDHRRDREQVVIGLLVTDEGMPIAHQVYPGNTKYSTTLTDQIHRLKKTFGIKQCVLVVDRGLVTKDNLTELVSEGYQYIVALRKRKRELFQPVLANNRMWLQPVEGQKNLLGFETSVEEFGGDRVIFCYNSEKAEVEARHRQERLDKAKTRLKQIQGLFLSGKRVDREKLLQQAARYLERKKQSRFFQLHTDENKGITFTLKQEMVDFEAELDGLFVLRTNREDLSIAEVVSAYKTLARAESAFKELKDFIELRPMRHWTEKRVRAHIFICVLAYLIETCIEIKLKEKGLEMTARKALDILSEIKLVNQEIDGLKIAYLIETCIEIKLKEKGLEMTARKALDILSEIKLVNQEIDGLKICTYSQPSAESRRIIKALGLRLPKEKLFVK